MEKEVALSSLGTSPVTYYNWRADCTSAVGEKSEIVVPGADRIDLFLYFFALALIVFCRLMNKPLDKTTFFTDVNCCALI